MKPIGNKPQRKAVATLNTPAAVARFKKLARDFDARLRASPESAQLVLRREGVLTAKGNLTRRYSGK